MDFNDFFFALGSIKFICSSKSLKGNLPRGIFPIIFLFGFKDFIMEENKKKILFANTSKNRATVRMSVKKVKSRNRKETDLSWVKIVSFLFLLLTLFSPNQQDDFLHNITPNDYILRSNLFSVLVVLQ